MTDEADKVRPEKWRINIFSAHTGELKESRLEPRIFIDQAFLDLITAALKRQGKILVKWEVGIGTVQLFVKAARDEDDFADGEVLKIDDGEDQ